MAIVTIPEVRNPGVSFTYNSYVIIRNVRDHFSGCTRDVVPYNEFQESYNKFDPKGDSKIRMLFPLYRKAGCIYPYEGDGEGDGVRFVNGSFFTQLGESFFKISSIYFETLEKVKALRKANSKDDVEIINMARALYFKISKILFENLCESEDVYKHLYTFLRDFAPVSKEEISLLLFSLEKTSSERGVVVRCDYDKGEISTLIQQYRTQNLEIRKRKANNADYYFMAVLKSLLIASPSGSNYVLTPEGKSL